MLRLWLGALWWSRVWRTQHPFLCTAGEAQIPINQKSGELKALSTLSSQTPLRRIPHSRELKEINLSTHPLHGGWVNSSLCFFPLLHSCPRRAYCSTIILLVIFLDELQHAGTGEWFTGDSLLKKKKKKLLLFNLYNKPWGFAKSPQAWMAFPFCSQDKLLQSLPSPVTCAETLLSVINSYISKPAVERIPIIITTLSATITTVNKWW